DMNTRAVARSPTSAIASAAVENGSRVPIEGMMAAAHTIEPNTTYGANRNSGDAFAASTASLWNSLWIARYGCQMLGADLFCSHARHCAIQPPKSGATAIAASTSSVCVSQEISALTAPAPTS